MAEATRDDLHGWRAVLTADEARQLGSVLDRWAAMLPALAALPPALRDVRRLLGKVERLAEAYPVAPSGGRLPSGAMRAVDVADRLGVDVDEVPKLIRSGELLGEHRARPVGWLVLGSSVDAYVKRQRRAKASA